MGTIVLLAVSFIAAGPGWIRSYIALILDPAVDPDSPLMPNLHSMVAHIPGRDIVEFFLSLTVVVFVWWIARRARFDVALAATLLGSILLTRHAYLQDCAILAGSLVTLFETLGSPLVRSCALVLLLAAGILFMLIREGAVVAALYLVLLIAVGFAEVRGLETGGRS